MTSVEALERALERAERDAQRWEQAAITAELDRNAAHAARKEAEDRVAEMEQKIRDQARDMIASLHEMARRIADRFGVPMIGLAGDDVDLDPE